MCVAVRLRFKVVCPQCRWTKKFTRYCGEPMLPLKKDNYEVCPKCGTKTRQIGLNKWDKVEDFLKIAIAGAGVGLFLAGEAISERIFKKKSKTD